MSVRFLCPACGSYAEFLFRDINNDTFGCDECVTQVDIDDLVSERNDEERDYRLDIKQERERL